MRQAAAALLLLAGEQAVPLRSGPGFEVVELLAPLPPKDVRAEAWLRAAPPSPTIRWWMTFWRASATGGSMRVLQPASSPDPCSSPSPRTSVLAR